MKKNKMMRIASVLLVAVLLSTSVISGTFAKYTSEKSDSDTARVAQWNIKLNDATMTANSVFDFDLFKTIVSDEDDSNEDDSNETDVKEGTTDEAIIAPGTKGAFTIHLVNASEVTAQYAIDYIVTKSDDRIPVKFSVDNGEHWTDNLADIVASESTKLAMPNDGDTDEASITIQWKWDFNGDNTVDTSLGLDGTATIQVTAKVTVEQVN